MASKIWLTKVAMAAVCSKAVVLWLLIRCLLLLPLFVDVLCLVFFFGNTVLSVL